MTRVPQKTCEYGECTYPHLAKGLCAQHYDRNRAGRDMDKPLTYPKDMPTCKAPECDWKVVRPNHTYCITHRMRATRGADPDVKVINSRVLPWGVCEVDMCNKRVESKQGALSTYCAVHNNQVRRGVTPGVYRIPNGTYDECQVPGCTGEYASSGLCNAHVTRKNTYSLTSEEFIELITSPCSICGDRGRISVDHDHSCCPGEKSCGKCVRGPLCGLCNLGLGAFRDNTDRLMKAVEYLNAPPGVKEVPRYLY